MTTAALEKLLLLYAQRFPLRRGKMRVIDSLWRAAVGDSSTHRVASLKHGDFMLPCDLSAMLQRQLYFFGTYFVEEYILRCWETAAKGEVIFDVGANAGIYSLAALAVQPDATVHAFEPTPEIAAGLRATARLNGLNHLHVHEVAVLDRAGQATLRRFRGELGANEGMNFVTRDVVDPTGERVETISLDRFCQNCEIEHVDLLKLDIQGHEPSALVGAANMLAGGRIGTIFSELNWARDRATACPASEVVRLLDQAGYSFSKPGKHLHWKKAGHWLRMETEIIATQSPRKAIR
ncbi:MAG: hypothetical protein DMF90_28475 [Acidobacteria bacterium]|nr:MAG: hypothetical protein DMF90_28475 [Acidobacteriota bacterium]